MDAPLSKDVEIKCVGCSKVIKTLDWPGNNEAMADRDCYDDGFVHTVVAGFGSKHDTSQFLIGICDGCGEKFVEDGRLIKFWDQFNGYTQT